MKKNLIQCKHAENLGDGWTGNPFISGQKTLILTKEQKDQAQRFRGKVKVENIFSAMDILYINM